MYAVIFEVEPARAASRIISTSPPRCGWPKLEKIDGFISIERFESLARKGKILSLSFWRDEAAVRRWREQVEHRAAQAQRRPRRDFRRLSHLRRHSRSRAPIRHVRPRRSTPALSAK